MSEPFPLRKEKEMARIIKQNKIEAIDYTENVRVTKMGNIIEVQQSNIRGKGGKIKKISKDEYIDTTTGEIKKFNKHNRTSRKENHNSLYQTFRKAKEIINSNFKGVSCTVLLRWHGFCIFQENIATLPFMQNGKLKNLQLI